MQKLIIAKQALFKLISGTFLFITSYGLSAQTYPPPSGVYCSCGPTTGVGYGSVNPSIAVKPFVKGILVRVAWELVEPTDNNYNWSLIDGQITAANTYGKKISLGIGCGIMIPQWVFDAGAQRLVTPAPIVDTIAVPWDAIFLNKWTEFISALGARYQNDTTINLVYITTSSQNGFEMQLPPATTPTLTAVGYTDAKMISSWKTIMNSFNSAFPNHYLTNDFHPVNGSDVVADSVYEYAVSAIGSRYGASAWWWSQHNTTVYPSQYVILQNSTINNNFTGIQMVKSGTLDSAKFGPGGMPAALQLAKSDGICYWEFWNSDILNPAFDSLLNNTYCTPVTGIKEENDNPNIFQTYPNPANDKLYISFFDNEKFQLKIFNNLGEEVLNCQLPNNSSPATLDISGLRQGIYFICIITDKQKFYYRKLIIAK